MDNYFIVFLSKREIKLPPNARLRVGIYDLNPFREGTGEGEMRGEGEREPGRERGEGERGGREGTGAGERREGRLREPGEADYFVV